MTTRAHASRAGSARNRPLDEASAFITRSEDVDVPGNLDLSEAEKAARAEVFYGPGRGPRAGGSAHGRGPAAGHGLGPLVHARLSRARATLADRRPLPARSAARRADTRGPAADPALTVGNNQPYPVALDRDYTVPVHAELLGLPYVLFEVPQDLLGDEAGIETWARRLGALLAEALTDPSLDHLAAPATDLEAPRYRKRG